MQHLKLVPRLTLADMQTVLDRCTPADAEELKAAGLEYSVEPFRSAIEGGRFLGAIWSHHAPVAAFGCIAHVLDEKIGIPWMIATPEFRLHPREAMALSRQQVDLMQGAFDWLYNLVHCEHLVAIRWLMWLGFHVELDKPTGPGGAFLPFSWSKFNV